MALAFGQLWHGLHFPRLGSDLVPVPPAVCSLFDDRIRSHARGRARRDRLWWHCGWGNLSPPQSPSLPSSGSVAAVSTVSARVISFVSWRIASSADGRV